VCKWFALGLVFQDFCEFLLSKFEHLLGIVVEASLVQLLNEFTLFHRLPLLTNIYLVIFFYEAAYELLL
jgi:hypothetical protein